MKIHEYQAKEILRRFGVATPRGVACFTLDEALEAGPAARRAGVGRQGPDPRRRTRQGRGREARAHPGGAEAARAGHPGHAPGHASDRAGGPHRPPPAHRGGRRHPRRALHRHGRGPLIPARGADGLQRRRDGHRGSRSARAREDPQGVHRPDGWTDCGSGHRRRAQDRHPGCGAAPGGRTVANACTGHSTRPTLRWSRSTR